MNGSRSVLVTGGNGFIGRHLVRRLLRDGHRIALLQRSPDRVDPRVAHIPLSRLDIEGLAAALSGERFEWVFHLAGYGVRPAERDPETMFQVNIEFTRAIVELAASWSPKAVLIAGSGSEYNLDGIQRPINEDQLLETSRLYGASKAAGTSTACALATAWKVPFAACRLFGVYGPGEAPHRLLPSLIAGLPGQGRIPLSSGVQRRDFLFVDDVVEAFMTLAAALEAYPWQYILNVATGEPVSVRSFVKVAADVLGINEDRLGFGDIPMRADEPMLFSGNPARLKALTSWMPRVDLPAGIRRCLDVAVAGS
jgi:nucleoside-diphosphate-sugar epimerase